MGNKKLKSQATKQKINTRYLLIVAATVAIGFIMIFLIAFAVIGAYIGTIGGIIGGLIIALLFALVIARNFLSRFRPQARAGHKK